MNQHSSALQYKLSVASQQLLYYLLTFVASSCSDNEEDRVSQNGRPAKSEFKDDEETVTTKSVQITQTTDAITSTTTTTTSTRKRGGVPSKTVDLGAAAHYTGSKSSPDADNNKVKYCLHPNSSCWKWCIIKWMAAVLNQPG